MDSQQTARTARPAPGTSPTISLRDVSLRFPPPRGATNTGPTTVLDRVSLDIAQGEFVALVGASGCGKTSILNLVAGLLRVNNGSVSITGHEVTAPTAETGYMFARDALLPWRTALRNVELAMEGRPGWTKDKRRARATEMLHQLGLKGSEGRYRAQLSQGMRQRVALARTFAPSPSVLLMDEPFAALDALTKTTIQKQFLQHWEAKDPSERQTVVFVTHDLQEAVLLADRVVVLASHPGRIHYQHTVDLPRPRAQVMEEIIFTDDFRQIHALLFAELQAARAIDTAAATEAPA